MGKVNFKAVWEWLPEPKFLILLYLAAVTSTTVVAVVSMLVEGNCK